MKGGPPLFAGRLLFAHDKRRARMGQARENARTNGTCREIRLNSLVRTVRRLSPLKRDGGNMTCE